MGCLAGTIRQALRAAGKPAATPCLAWRSQADGPALLLPRGRRSAAGAHATAASQACRCAAGRRHGGPRAIAAPHLGRQTRPGRRPGSSGSSGSRPAESRHQLQVGCRDGAARRERAWRCGPAQRGRPACCACWSVHAACLCHCSVQAACGQPSHNTTLCSRSRAAALCCCPVPDQLTTSMGRMLC